jgi:hypothetical protein
MYINCPCTFTHEIETSLKTKIYSLYITCERNSQNFARNPVGKNVKHKFYTLPYPGNYADDTNIHTTGCSAVENKGY